MKEDQMASRSMVPSWRNTSLSPWGEGADPFSAFRREMNRLFDTAFGDFGLPSFGSPAFGVMAAPKIDVSESDNEIRIAAELPGIDEKNVEVMLAGDMLTIRGERKEEHEDKQHNYHVRECTHGAFSRSLPLPFGADPNQVKAAFKNGVLTVTIPKPKEAQQKQHRIEVQRDSSSGNTSPAQANQTSGTASSSTA
ncbi:MAG: Hsp20/alpha crystallin family protein [Alphaproteobacteria bacterium]|nr:Hsp20/alpha crystallin family protein [Alphaproteobacteria bacterium]